MSKDFYVTFVVTRGGVRQSNVEISYLYNGSKRNLTSDFTDKHGEAQTKWQRSSWLNKEIDVFFDGYHKHTIKLLDNDRDIFINLPSGCFPYKTEIATPLGTRPIGDIDDGDLVLSFNADTGLLANKRVIKKIVHAPMRIFEVRMKNGESLFVTQSHRLLSTKGYVSVAKLKSGDCLLIKGNAESYAIFDEVIQTSRIEPVYNLVVADEFTFIADGFVAHSFTAHPKLQAYFWTVYDKLNKHAKNALLSNSKSF